MSTSSDRDRGTMSAPERLARIYTNLGELQQSTDHDTPDALVIIEEIAVDVALVTKARSDISYADIASSLEGLARFFRRRADDEDQ